MMLLQETNRESDLLGSKRYSSANKPEYKIAVVGGGAVGKSTIIVQYVQVSNVTLIICIRICTVYTTCMVNTACMTYKLNILSLYNCVEPFLGRL